MVRILEHTGFQISFENGYTVSVVFGFGSRSDNNMREKAKECKNCEVAIMYTGLGFVTEDICRKYEEELSGIEFYGETIANVTPEELAKIIYLVSKEE